MARRLCYSKIADEDLWQIRRYHAERGELAVAGRFEQRLMGTLRRSILKFPRSGRLRLEFGPNIRSVSVSPYVVFYTVKNGSVHVLRILHGHRDIHPPLMSLLTAV